MRSMDPLPSPNTHPTCPFFTVWAHTPAVSSSFSPVRGRFGKVEFLELHRPKEYLHQWAFVKLEAEEAAQQAMEVRCPWLRLRHARDVWWRNHPACPPRQPAAASIASFHGSKALQSLESTFYWEPGRGGWTRMTCLPQWARVLGLCAASCCRLALQRPSACLFDRR